MMIDIMMIRETMVNLPYLYIYNARQCDEIRSAMDTRAFGRNCHVRRHIVHLHFKGQGGGGVVRKETREIVFNATWHSSV